MNVKTITRFILSTTLSLVLIQATSAQVFWSETFDNEADFNAEWTNGGDNGGGGEEWVWSDDPSALLFGSQPPFGSTTADDGFIIFNSDGNGNAAHDVTITSSAIDCSGQSQVFLRCENQYGYFSTGGVSIAEVGVSTDGTDFLYYSILADVEQNDLSAAVQEVFIELPEAANQPEVYIQFRWRGFFEYTWRIDDISLSSENPQPINNLVLIQPRVPFNFATPVSMIDTVFMGMGIENNGQADQFNVSASATLMGDNGDSFMTTEFTDTLLSDSSVFFFFDESFIPTGEGNYTIEYETGSDSTDASPGNNVDDAVFIITEDLFSKDDGNIASATQPAEIAGDFWEIGNYYVANNGGFEAFEADISVASNDDAHQGQSITVFLYEVNEDDNEEFTDDDLSVVGFGEYTFGSEENFDLVTVELFDLLEGTQGVELFEGVEYFLTVQYTPEMFSPFSALAYYYDVATVVRDDDGSWFLGGFGPDVTLIARMRIRESGSVATDEPALAESKINMFPNPVNTELNVQLELEDVNEQVEVKIIDATGRTMQANIYENFRTQQLTFNTEKYAAGTYFLHVRTSEGVSSKRFVVQH
jgi:hypothetical protein